MLSKYQMRFLLLEDQGKGHLLDSQPLSIARGEEKSCIMTKALVSNHNFSQYTKSSKSIIFLGSIDSEFLMTLNSEFRSISSIVLFVL